MYDRVYKMVCERVCKCIEGAYEVVCTRRCYVNRYVRECSLQLVQGRVEAPVNCMRGCVYMRVCVSRGGGGYERVYEGVCTRRCYVNRYVRVCSLQLVRGPVEPPVNCMIGCMCERVCVRGW